MPFALFPTPFPYCRFLLEINTHTLTRAAVILPPLRARGRGTEESVFTLTLENHHAGPVSEALEPAPLLLLPGKNPVCLWKVCAHSL